MTPDGDEFRREICEALGLSAPTVQRLTILIEAGEPVKVAVVRWIRPDEASRIVARAKRYKLVPAD